VGGIRWCREGNKTKPRDREPAGGQARLGKLSLESRQAFAASRSLYRRWNAADLVVVLQPDQDSAEGS